MNDRQRRIFNELQKVSDRELATVKALCEKHGTKPADTIQLTLMLQLAGFGRNPQTAALLRCVAELVESPLTTIETIEAKVDGHLQ